MDMRAASNPVWVVPQTPADRIYWGDLHSHAVYSFDGIGWDPFAYAREVSALDFYALTEHARGVRDQDWEVIKRATRAAHAPGQFVTLHAYECSLPTPSGHNNVYWKDDDPPLVRETEVAGIEELWRRLGDGTVFTVPHHPGIHFAQVGWRTRNDRMRPLAEIYSMHGLGEMDDPSHPLSYENTKFSLNHHMSGSWFIRDGWRLGHRPI